MACDLCTFLTLSGRQREKTCLRGFRQIEIQTSLLSYRDYLNWNFACSKSRYDTFQTANNKGADQTERMLRLVCTFVVGEPPKKGFLVLRPIYSTIYSLKRNYIPLNIKLKWVTTWKSRFGTQMKIWISRSTCKCVLSIEYSHTMRTPSKLVNHALIV